MQHAPTAGNGQIAISWSASNGADGYKVKYGNESGSYTTVVDVGNVIGTAITGLNNGTALTTVINQPGIGSALFLKPASINTGPFRSSIWQTFRLKQPLRAADDRHSGRRANVPGTALDWAGQLGGHTIRISVADPAGNVAAADYMITVETSVASMEQLLDCFSSAGGLASKGSDDGMLIAANLDGPRLVQLFVVPVE